jgi:hypothetical protein
VAVPHRRSRRRPMCGCCSAAAIRISRWNRSTRSPSATSDDGTLTTTSRPSASPRATKTRHIPPPPSSAVSVYARPSDAWSVSRSGSVIGLSGLQQKRNLAFSIWSECRGCDGPSAARSRASARSQCVRCLATAIEWPCSSTKAFGACGDARNGVFPTLDRTSWHSAEGEAPVRATGRDSAPPPTSRVRAATDRRAGALPQAAVHRCQCRRFPAPPPRSAATLVASPASSATSGTRR